MSKNISCDLHLGLAVAGGAWCSGAPGCSVAVASLNTKSRLEDDCSLKRDEKIDDVSCRIDVNKLSGSQIWPEAHNTSQRERARADVQTSLGSSSPILMTLMSEREAK
jgi:hypothetical protein